MERKLLTYLDNTVEYFVKGNGDKAIVCCHGFGRTAYDFEHIQFDQSEYQLIVVHFFFHGQSISSDENPISKSDWSAIIQRIVNQEIGSSQIDTLTAYSMGARFALCYLEEKVTVKRVILMAPDGIGFNGWHLMTKKRFGRWLFRYTILRNPKIFFGFIKTARFLRLLPKSLYKFLHFHLDDPQNRQLVYDVWCKARELTPDHTKLKANWHYDTELIFGRFDKTIPASYGEKFKTIIGKDVHVSIVYSNHDLMRPEILSSLNLFKA